MTCIIGLTQDGKVYIGADSLASSGNDKFIRSQSKVFRFGDFLIACTGNSRIPDLIRTSLSIKSQRRSDYSENDFAYIANDFVGALRLLLSDSGHLHTEHGVDNMPDNSSLLLGYNGELYEVYSDFGVGVYINGMVAIGAGSDFALGAMLAMPNKPPVERILEALRISAQACAFVSEPFNIMILGE